MANAYWIVALVFVAAGSLSTIASKWTDSLSAVGRDGKVSKFDHPFIQTWFMFLGEFTCMIYFQGKLLYKRYKQQELVEGEDFRKPITPFIMLIPACCDFTASTTMYYGLTMTHASVYQMLRGATVLFTGLFSRFFLKRVFRAYQWSGMLLVTLGLTCVGLSSTLFETSTDGASNPVLGDILIIAAQLIVSAQMVIEEKILTKWNIPPTLLVGWEGTFGLCITTTALGIFQAFHTPPDDFIDAVIQMGNSWRVLVSNLLALAAIPLLNAMGQIITKNISATARMVLDTVRNIVVWAFCLAYTSYFHETFQWLQLVGFLLLVSGNGIFKYIIRLPCGFCRDPVIDAEAEEKGKLVDGVDGTVNDSTPAFKNPVNESV